MEEIINPFYSLRVNANLTLGELAAYSRIDIRALTRSEYGMYMRPLPNLTSYWVRRGTISEGQLLTEYEDYQFLTRKSNHRLFGPLTFDDGSKIHPLRQFRAQQKLGLVALCKALCIPLDTVQYFEKKWRVQKIVPKGLLLALNQAGYTQQELRVFQDAYDKWRDDNRSVLFHEV